MSCLAYLTEYQAISQYYGERTAQRSGVPLINHIHEGVKILKAIGASTNAIKGFCLHPLYQNDLDLEAVGLKHAMTAIDAYPVMLAMEYRHTANAYLSDKKLEEGEQIRLSPLKDVNDMLIADKVQNRKDFEIYHKGTHPRSDRLTQYFSEWLYRLGISEERYQELAALIS